MAMPIPSLLLKQLYTFASLKNLDSGVSFSLKNRLSDATLNGLARVSIDDQVVPLKSVWLELGPGNRSRPEDLKAHPLDFPLR
ncbi:MAG: hydroxymethylglutaryl-CoA reductase, partial [Calditrichaeota bacterium]|nr:hydroxymethylglutaryl-CoA reductase [Calditrichota bacterium]